MGLQRVVILGGGQAGFQVAASLRQDGYAGRIALVGDEPGLPYRRPPLSKAYLLGKMGLDGLQLRPASFYVEQAIDRIQDRAVAIDRAGREVRLRSGARLPYDHLVLALGADNRPLPVPGAELDGVCGLRTLADADALRARLETARDAVVVGAGFIGLEFAAVASALGARVRVIEVADRPMARSISPAMAEVFTAAHAGWGVELLFGEKVVRILGAGGKATAVVTAEGRRIAADLVVVGVGVIPNTTLAAEAGLAVADGIVVDHDLLTGDPAISAIGDCAFFPSPHAGTALRLESVQNATDQARAVAARLTGKAAPYAAVPWFWSDQRDLKLQIAGLSIGCDRTVLLGKPETASLSVLLFREGRLAAVESVNRPADHVAARKLLAGVPTLTPEAASQPGFDLKAWTAAAAQPKRPQLSTGAAVTTSETSR